VAEVDALLYLPGQSGEQLQRALRIPALSKGWLVSLVDPRYRLPRTLKSYQ
jgi:hypothetical protein